VTVGRTEEPINWVSALSGGHNEEHGHLGTPMGDTRNSGHINYTWSGYGFTGGVDYQTASDKFNANTAKLDSVDVDSGFTVVAGYTSPVVLFAPISIRAGYRYLNGQDEDLRAGVDDVKGFEVAASWGTWGNGFYIGAGYSTQKATYIEEGRDDYKFKGWETVVGYGFGNGVNLRTGYAWRSIENAWKNDEGKYTGKKDAGVVPVIVSWDINSNFRVWAEANIKAGGDDVVAYKKDTSGEAANCYHIGVRYTF